MAIIAIVLSFGVYAFLNYHHTGVVFPMIFLPLRHWVVFTIVMIAGITVSYTLLHNSNNIRIKVKEFRNSDKLFENVVYLFFLGIITFIFVYTVRNSAFLSNYDDLVGSARLVTTPFHVVMENLLTFELGAARHGFSIYRRILHVITFLAYNYDYGNLTVFNIFFYAPIIANLFLFVYIISKRTNKYLGLLVATIYFPFAQLIVPYQLFLSFPFSFHVYFAFFLLSAELFLRHFEKPRRYHLPLSALFLYMSIIGYELFLMYFALFPAFLLCRSINGKAFKQAVVHFFKSLPILKFHFASVLLYLVNYFGNRMLFFQRGGTFAQTYTVDFGADIMSLRSMFDTLWVNATDLFPLNVFHRGSFIDHFHISHINPEHIIMAFCTMFLCCVLLSKNIKISGKKVTAICFIALVAGFLFPVPLALSVQYNLIISSYRMRGFVAPFFSYYWWILIIAVLMVYIYSIMKFKKVLLLLIAPAVFFTSIFTAYSNSFVIERMERQHNRYSAFHRIVSSYYFAGIEEESLILTQGYNMDSHDHGKRAATPIARRNSGRTVSFINDSERFSDTEHRYFMMYDFNVESILFGKVENINSGIVGNEALILPALSFSNGTIFGELSGFSEVYINGRNMGQHYRFFIIPLSDICSDGIFVEATGMHLNQLAVVDTQLSLNNQIIQVIQAGVSYGAMYGHHSGKFYDSLYSGWSYIQEGSTVRHDFPDYVWSDGDSAELRFLVLSDAHLNEDIHFAFTGMGFAESTNFSVYINDKHAGDYSIPGHSSTDGWNYSVLSITVPNESVNVIDGIFEMNVRFDIYDFIVPIDEGFFPDPRELGIALTSFRID
jgi:hypothetical protein